MTRHTRSRRHVEMWFPAVIAGVVTAAVVLGVPFLLSQQYQFSQAVAGGSPETLTSTASATEAASDAASEPAGKPATYRGSAPPVGAWAELHDGVLRLAPGVRKLAQRDNPVGLAAPADSVGLVLERDRKTRWVLAIDNGTSGTSTTSDPAGQGVGSFDDWLTAQAALVDVAATATYEQPTLVELTPDRGLVASEPGVQMLAQRRGIDLGPNFASPTELTAAAQVEYRGRVLFVLARRIDGVVDYVTTESTARTLDAFLREARQRYKSELGYR